MKKVFVCSPYRGDIEKNTANVKKYCKYVGFDAIPIAPHLFFTQFLNEKTHRWLGVTWGLELLKECDEIHVFAEEVSEGMEQEIKRAIDLKIPIRFFNEHCREIKTASLLQNETIGPKYKRIIMEALQMKDAKCICPYADECRFLMEYFENNRKGKGRHV